jgi:hypothetical protein
MCNMYRSKHIFYSIGKVQDDFIRYFSHSESDDDDDDDGV